MEHHVGEQDRRNRWRLLPAVIIANERRSESVQSTFFDLFTPSFTFKKVGQRAAVQTCALPPARPPPLAQPGC